MADLLNFSELDYVKIKQQLRDFLRSKPDMQAFDFEGSGWSYLIDLLAYNTSQNAFYLNMVANESFLDSAVLYQSVASRAKMLGYFPRNKTSSQIKIRVDYIINGDNPAYIYIDRDTKLAADIDDVTYTYTLPESIYVYPDNITGEYTTGEIELFEGERLTHRFTVNNNTNQKFIIPNIGIDVSKLIVSVQESEFNLGVTTYSRSVDITTQDKDSKVYYLQETLDHYVELIFGDDIISYKPKTGNIIVVEYIISNGSVANGIAVLDAPNDFGVPTYNALESGSVTPYITITQKASGGQDEESISSIKQFAPLHLEVQNRGVTKSDFEYLIKKNYQFVDSVKVWGGETNIPPKYGEVMIAIKPSDGFILDAVQKQYLKTDIIQKISTLCQIPNIVDPVYTHIDITNFVRYDQKQTRRLKQEVQEDILNIISNYIDEEVSYFDGVFFSSKLQNNISNSNVSIVSNLLSIKMKDRIYPSLTTQRQYEINFQNPIEIFDPVDFYGKAIRSSEFIYNNGHVCFIAEEGPSSYNLCIFQKTSSYEKLIKVKTIGEVDFINGYLNIQNFAPESFMVVGKNYIDFLVKPQKQDLAPKGEQIFVCEPEDIHVQVEVIK